MKQYSIIMSAENVLAVLSGRKSQTRHLVRSRQGKHRRLCESLLLDPETYFVARSEKIYGGHILRNSMSSFPFICRYGMPGDVLWVREKYQQEVDGTYLYAASEDGIEEGWLNAHFMPRRASRVVLEVVSVNIERLHMISDYDLEAEGFDSLPEYKKMWNRLNKPVRWESNPLVWVIGFKKIIT